MPNGLSSAFLVPLFATVGLALGSFANVVILRYGSSGWVAGRSKCPRCKHRLKWYDLIPLASFVSLGGYCRYCRKPISAQYPLVELASAAIFLVTLWRTPDEPLLAALSGIVLFTLLVTAVVDARHQQIPDLFSAIIAATALVSTALYASVYDAAAGMAVGAAWFAWQWAASGGRWVGSGDIFLAGALGLWLGLWPTVAMLVLAYGIGALVALALLFSGRARLGNTRLAFAPFLGVGTLLAFLGAADWYVALLK